MDGLQMEPRGPRCYTFRDIFPSKRRILVPVLRRNHWGNGLERPRTNKRMVSLSYDVSIEGWTIFIMGKHNPKKQKIILKWCLNWVWRGYTKNKPMIILWELCHLWCHNFSGRNPIWIATWRAIAMFEIKGPQNGRNNHIGYTAWK